MGHYISISIIAIILSFFYLQLRKCKVVHNTYVTKSIDERKLDRLMGLIQQLTIEAKVTKKLAENAFRMASASNVSVSILSKGIGARPKFISKEQLVSEAVAKGKLEDLFGNEEAEFLKPLLSDDEIELIDEARKQYEKAKAKGEVL